MSTRNLSSVSFPSLLNKRELSGREVRQNLFANFCSQSTSLYSKNLLAHFGCVNAVEFSKDGSLMVSGSDDRRVLLWKTGRCLTDTDTVKIPVSMRAEHNSNIFCLDITDENDKILSGGNDEQVILHDSRTGEPLDYFLHEQPVFSVCLNPVCNCTFATAGDDGRILIFDTREPYSTNSISMTLAVSEAAFHSVMFNPIDPRIIATANAKEGAALWDVRKPKTCLYQFETNRKISHGGMSVRFDRTGTRLLCLRRRKFPILYDVTQPCQKGIELKQEGYGNFCTMKSCCFAGERDELAVSGSDDNYIYLWKIPENNFPESVVPKASIILKGHRSIVNQVRYNPYTCCLASAGVEKIIKLWTPVPLRGGNADLSRPEEERPRRKFTPNDYIRLILRHGQLLSHSFPQRCIEEDTNMLAFFDMLVQKEKEEEFDFDCISTDSDSDRSVESEDSSSIHSLESSSDTSSSWSESNNLVSPIRSGRRIVSYDEFSPGPSGVIQERPLSDSESSEEESRLDLPSEVANRGYEEVNPVLALRRTSVSDEETQTRNNNAEGCDSRVEFRRRVRSKGQYRRHRSSSDSSS